FNGEIYNYVELGEDLRDQGVQLRSRSDTEVLVELYSRLGPAMVHELRGMFALAVWDRENRHLFAARDPFGIKPLFYAVDDNGLLRFASEKKALLAPWLGTGGRFHAAGPGPGPCPGPEPEPEPAVDQDVLRRYLAFQYVPGPATLSPDIHALPPGHTLSATPGRPLVLRRYWRPDLRPARRPRPHTTQRLVGALRDSVRVHLRSDVPVGAFLSGGIDSAAICALAREHRPDLPTFTVGFDQPGYDETDLARRTATALGLITTSRLISARDVVEQLPRIVWHLDDPLADPSAVALWFLAEEAAREVKVVLSGEGADELFGGYRIYRQPWVVRAGGQLPEWTTGALRRLAARLPEGLRGRGLLHRISTPLAHRYIGNAHVFDDEQLDRITATRGSRGGRGAGPYDVTTPLHAQAADDELDDVATMQLVDIATWLPGDILAKADRMTMAHSLELRVPFLDPAVFATATRLSRPDKLDGRETKHALRRALARLLPPDVVSRPKLGFPVPTRHWLAHDLAPWAEEILRTASIDEHIDRRVALDLLARHRAGTADHSRRLWCLLIFALWHQVFVEGRYRFAEKPGEPSPFRPNNRERAVVVR
ncbi:MAG TPA: asparagine synthase-related protein, partial [Acidimicrobiales bacterium]